jgi:hypothetical protein
MLIPSMANKSFSQSSETVKMVVDTAMTERSLSFIPGPGASHALYQL